MQAPVEKLSLEQEIERDLANLKQNPTFDFTSFLEIVQKTKSLNQSTLLESTYQSIVNSIADCYIVFYKKEPKASSRKKLTNQVIQCLKTEFLATDEIMRAILKAMDTTRKSANSERVSNTEVKAPILPAKTVVAPTPQPTKKIASPAAQGMFANKNEPKQKSKQQYTYQPKTR